MFKHLDQYKKFESITAAKAAFNEHLNNNTFNTNTRRVFEYILSCSTNHAGAATILRATIVKALSLSLATVTRAIATLKRAKAVAVKGTGRGTQIGGRGANIFIIQPFENEDVLSEIDSALPDDTNETNVDKLTDDSLGDSLRDSKGNSNKTSGSKGSHGEKSVATTINSSNNHLKHGSRKQASLLAIFSDYVNLGLTKKKYLEIIKEAESDAINLVAFVRSSCKNYIENKNKKKQRYENLEKTGAATCNPFSVEALKAFSLQKEAVKLDELFNPWA